MAAPIVTNINVYQRTTDGKVVIQYDVDAEGIQGSGQILTISFKYWDGSDYENCITVTGDVGSIQEGTGKEAVWTTKTDIDGFNSLNCKIRIIATDWLAQTSETDSSEFALDVKNPVITIIIPTNGGIQYNRRFKFQVDITEQSNYQIKFEVSFTGGVSFNSIFDSGWLDNANEWDYTQYFRPLVFSEWFWRISARDEYQNETVIL